MSDAHDNERLLEHNYDGIQEYDNPLPRWWVVLFWITIVFTPLYFLYYHWGPGMLTIEAYNQDMIAYYDQQAQQFLAMGEVTEKTLIDLQQKSSMMAGAKALFQTKCSPCHGMNGEGNIGPNLTDDYWLHGNKLTDIYHTVMEGVPSKGMLSWKTQLGPAELLSVAAYVGTLRGSNPPNPKKPQGELMPYDATAALAGAADEPEAATPDEAGG